MTTHNLLAGRRLLLFGVSAAAAAAIAGRSVKAATEPAQRSVEVWKSTDCTCCDGWVRHIRASGFAVSVHEVDDITPVKQARGVPQELWSCHTAVSEGYVLEGHIPAPDLKRLLAERPQAKGLAVPGMEPSSPGMDQPGQAYAVILFGSPGGNRTYARHA
jgi:hypothetical protein